LRRPAQESGRTAYHGDAVRYLFIVSRKNPDILARVQERLRGDPRIEVIADRRYGERRRAVTPYTPERRGGDRRRPTNVWNDLSIYPTLVAQRHVDSYAELERKLANASAETARLRDACAELEGRLATTSTENQRLRDSAAALDRQLATTSTENQRLRDTVADLERKLATAAADNQRLRDTAGEMQRLVDKLIAEDDQLRAENTRLRDDIAELQRRLGALAAAEAELKAEVSALLGHAEQTLSGLIATFQRLCPDAGRPKEPRLRSL
jgi:phage shock protein A